MQHMQIIQKKTTYYVNINYMCFATTSENGALISYFKKKFEN